MTEQDPVYGIIGVGMIAAAIVTGLVREGDGPQIWLSPRGAAVSSELAARFRSVAVCRDNQAVIDQSDVVLVCVRPQDAETVAETLRFRTGQTVISVVAGLRLQRLETLVAPAVACRAIPLPTLARGVGVTPIFPANAPARALFDQLGYTTEIIDEARFDAFSAATATIAAHINYLITISDWLVYAGIERDEADAYVASAFAGLDFSPSGKVALRDIARHHTTPGGINEAFARDLASSGFFDSVRAGLGHIYDRLRKQV